MAASTGLDERFFRVDNIDTPREERGTSLLLRFNVDRGRR